MDVSQTSAAAPVLARDLAHAARNYLGGRRGPLILAVAVVAAGAAALNWSWRAAAGIAPLLWSLLPCAAMCALGLCMSRMSWSRSPDDGAPDAETLPIPAPPIDQSLTKK